MLDIGEEDILIEEGCEDSVGVLGDEANVGKMAAVEVRADSVEYLWWELHGQLLQVIFNLMSIFYPCDISEPTITAPQGHISPPKNSRLTTNYKVMKSKNPNPQCPS